jgi:hypothetical protein
MLVETFENIVRSILLKFAKLLAKYSEITRSSALKIVVDLLKLSPRKLLGLCAVLW